MIETSVGLGSGIIYDTKGDIVTNNHVVAGSQSFLVITSAGKQYPATLVGTFAPDDLAVVHVNASGLRPATFGSSSALQIGDIVMAIGNPLGLQSSVSEGIVSAMRTAIPEGNGVTLPTAIQTTAAINPGNSGGALINLNEQVVGIPTLAATDPQLGGGAAPGIGFAIPSNTITLIAKQLIASGAVSNSGRAALGAQVTNTGGHGALVSTVKSGGPAARRNQDWRRDHGDCRTVGDGRASRGGRAARPQAGPASARQPCSCGRNPSVRSRNPCRAAVISPARARGREAQRAASTGSDAMGTAWAAVSISFTTSAG
jgi:S1-C subfamily serine protease